MGLSLSQSFVLAVARLASQRATILGDATFGKDFVPVSSDYFCVVGDLITRIISLLGWPIAGTV